MQDLSNLKIECDKANSDNRMLKHHFETSLKALEEANIEVSVRIEKKYQVKIKGIWLFVNLQMRRN